MGIKQYNPTSPGRRAGSVSDFSELTDKRRRPTKCLLEPKKKTGGRNHHGKITSWWRGGGHKRMYRLIDFKRRNDSGRAVVQAIEYDPNRSCHIALIEYPDKTRSYILAPAGLKAGDWVESGEQVEPKPGNCMPLKRIPVGMDVHNIEMMPGQGGKLVRSAGSSARLVAREGDWATLLLPSGEMRQVRVECRATIGQLGNADHQNIQIGKAGRKRHMGRRPHNRGTSMNPIAHPLGGGEGRSGGGRHPCSPWGKLAKGGKTRSPRKNSNKRILRRRRSVRYGRQVIRSK
ncbi:MAG TPA: 50S ribosomal protein L2 [Phycisphaerae bacterium]|nr:50S ribosomal protein L2 [Phycisphaerae bacterium]HRR87399.1 50S ribosomal protein L2 [Phycisphaerae bacterium]